jgi:hypothetical protein
MVVKIWRWLWRYDDGYEDMTWWLWRYDLMVMKIWLDGYEDMTWRLWRYDLTVMKIWLDGYDDMTYGYEWWVGENAEGREYGLFKKKSKIYLNRLKKITKISVPKINNLYTVIIGTILLVLMTNFVEILLSSSRIRVPGKGTDHSSSLST